MQISGIGNRYGVASAVVELPYALAKTAPAAKPPIITKQAETVYVPPSFNPGQFGITSSAQLVAFKNGLQ